MTATMTPDARKIVRLESKRQDKLPVKDLIACLPKQGEWSTDDYDFFAERMPSGPPLEFSRGRILRKEFSGFPLKFLMECLPKQGEWTMEEYDYFSNRLSGGPPFEFSHGRLVRKAMPLSIHTLIVGFLRWELEVFVRAKKLGRVYSEGAEFRKPDDLARYPDVVYMCWASLAKRIREGFPAMDLAAEVLSDSTRHEDLNAKRVDYAMAGVPEYWLVDPKLQSITVLTLAGSEYVIHSVFKRGEKATSVLLDGFAVDVSDALDGGIQNVGHGAP